MKLSNIIFLILLSGGGLMGAAEVPTHSVKSPAEAVQILKSSHDLEELTQALIIASADPLSRQTVIDFLNGPMSKEALEQQFFMASFPDSGVDLKNLDAVKRWATTHQRELKTISEEWVKIQENSRAKLGMFFAQSSDPAMFEIAKHIMDSRSMAWAWGAFDTNYAMALPKSSPQEQRFQDYVEYLCASTVNIGYTDASNNYVYAGRLDLQTGRFTTNLSPAELAQLKTGKEVRGRFSGLRFLNPDHLLRLILTNQVNDKDLETYINTDGFPGGRYGKDNIRLYLAALMRPDPPLHEAAVSTLFYPQFGSATKTPQVEDADPLVYAMLLYFIFQAQKYQYPAGISNPTPKEFLADAKTRLLALYAKHNMPVPTEAELAELAKGWLTPPASVASAPSATTPKPATPAKTASTPTPDTTPSTSWPLYALLGAAVLGGLFLLLRKR